MTRFLTRLRQAILPNWTSIKVWFSRSNLYKRAVLLTWSFLVFCLGLLLFFPGVAISQDSTWNPPVLLHSTENDVYDPILLSDESGRLHLFWSEVTEGAEDTAGQSLIYYMIRDEGAWSGPVDVLSLPRGFTNGLRGSIDEYGRPFLVLGGVSSVLQFSHAFNPDSLNALAWLPLRGLTGPQVGGEIAIGEAIHVVYGDVEGQINYLRIGVNGSVESSQVIAWLPGNQLLMRPPRMIQGADGTLHVILPSITPPAGDLGSYYLRSSDNGESWSDLVSISQPDRLAFSLVEDSNRHLHVFLAGRAGVGGRYHLVSEDGGESWSEIKIITLPEEGSGLSGGDLTLDSANRLHAVFGLANDTTVVHSEFNGTNWSDYTEISQGVSGFLENMEAELTHGNRLHIVWQNDHNSIWYVEGTSDAPSVEPKGIAHEPNLEPTPEQSLNRAVPEQATANPIDPGLSTESAYQVQPGIVSGSESLLIAAAASMLFIGLVIAVRYLLNRR